MEAAAMILPRPRPTGGRRDAGAAGCADLSPAQPGPRPATTFAAGTIFKGVTFDATASGFTLSGNQIGLAHLAGVANSSAVGQTASLPLNLGFGTHVISGGSGGLAVNGAVTRDVGAVAKFSGTVSSTSLTNDSTGIIGGWATVGSDWASVSGGKRCGVQWLHRHRDESTIVSAPGANLRWIQTTTGFTSALGTGTIDINSLKFGDSNQNATLTFTASTTLRFGANGGFFRSAPAFAGALNFGAIDRRRRRRVYHRRRRRQHARRSGLQYPHQRRQRASGH
jgi:hypothetical protein